MASEPTPIGGVEKQETGDNLNLWGLILNAVIDRLTEMAVGVKAVALSGDYTLDNTQYAENESRWGAIRFSDNSLSAAPTVTFPNQTRYWLIINTGSTHAINCVANESVVSAVSVAPGKWAIIDCDGADMFIRDLSSISGKLDLGSIADMTSGNVLGNLSGSTAGPSLITVHDEDDMSSDDATGLATQQSIKAYVDSEVSTVVADAGAAAAASAAAAATSETNAANDAAATAIDAAATAQDAIDAAASAAAAAVSETNAANSAASAGSKVSGPESATNNALVQFDGTTGKVVKNGPTIGTGANNVVQLDSNGNLPAVGGLPGSATLAATGAITAGDPVALNDDGTISVVGNTVVAASAGTPVQFTTSDIDYTRIVYDTTNDRVVIVYTDNTNSAEIYSVVGTVSGTTISFGTPVGLGQSYQFENGDVLFLPDEGKVLVSALSGASVYSAIGTVSGTSITWGSWNNETVGEGASKARLTRDEATGSVVLVYDQTTSDDLYAVVLSVSGNTVAHNTRLLINDNGADSWIWAAAGGGHAFVMYEAASNDSYGVLLTIDGTTLTRTSENFSFPEAWGWSSGGYLGISSNEAGMIWQPVEQCFVFIWSRSIDSYAICIYPRDDGKAFEVTRPFSFSENERGSATFNRFYPCYNPTTNRISLPYHDLDTDFARSIELKVENGVVTKDTSVTLNSEDSNDCAGVYDPDTGNVVIAYWDDADSDRGQSLVYTAPATYSNARKWIGIASETVADGADCTFEIIGGTNSNQSGLTVNAIYYLADDGTLTTDKTPYRVGRALSATELLIGGDV